MSGDLNRDRTGKVTLHQLTKARICNSLYFNSQLSRRYYYLNIANKWNRIGWLFVSIWFFRWNIYGHWSSVAGFSSQVTSKRKSRGHSRQSRHCLRWRVQSSTSSELSHSSTFQWRDWWWSLAFRLYWSGVANGILLTYPGDLYWAVISI